MEQERQVAEAANTQVQQLNQAKHKVQRADAHDMLRMLTNADVC